METIEQMSERHKKEVAELQKNCPHEHVKVHEYVYGYMFHGGNWEDYCEDCGKVIAYYLNPSKWIKSNKGMVQDVTKEERVKAEDRLEWHKNHPLKI